MKFREHPDEDNDEDEDAATRSRTEPTEGRRLESGTAKGGGRWQVRDRVPGKGVSPSGVPQREPEGAGLLGLLTPPISQVAKASSCQNRNNFCP